MWLQWRVVRSVRRRRVVRRGLLAGPKTEYLKQKEATRALVQARLVEFNQLYGFTYHRIAIKNSSTRWGSCSKQGNLNFHYKVGLLPSTLADYVLVHELCHLQELNHSPRFWALVAQTIPNHKQLRAQLKAWTRNPGSI